MMVQGSMLIRCWNVLDASRFDVDESMAGNLIIAKFIGALAIRPTMMIVMGWSQVIAAREAVKELDGVSSNNSERERK